MSRMDGVLMTRNAVGRFFGTFSHKAYEVDHIGVQQETICEVHICYVYSLFFVPPIEQKVLSCTNTNTPSPISQPQGEKTHFFLSSFIFSLIFCLFLLFVPAHIYIYKKKFCLFSLIFRRFLLFLPEQINIYIYILFIFLSFFVNFLSLFVLCVRPLFPVLHRR